MGYKFPTLEKAKELTRALALLEVSRHLTDDSIAVLASCVPYNDIYGVSLRAWDARCRSASITYTIVCFHGLDVR